MRQARKIIAPATTLKLVDKFSSSLPALPAPSSHVIPKGSHWVDMVVPDTIVVIEQPAHHHCAAIGGIMALRMTKRGAKGCLVGGRVRDLVELHDSGLPVWARGRSTVGTGAEAKVYARDIPVNISGIEVRPGDIVFLDPTEGAVVIPLDLLDEVIPLMQKLVAADDKVKSAVLEGMNVAEAFKKFRE